MMTDLFSTFDPATSASSSMNWTSTFIGMILMPSMYWMMPNRYTMAVKMMMMTLHNEFKTLLGKTKGTTLMMVSLFMFILFNNIMGLLPYVFTSSSHLVFTMSMALPMWMSLMLFGWVNKTQEMFAHLMPVGTPPALMPFMVIIETISNLIRPGALAVRLTANKLQDTYYKTTSKQHSKKFNDYCNITNHDSNNTNTIRNNRSQNSSLCIFSTVNPLQWEVE
uniref:ATP synthase subunit a n=1 Tax=Lethocerus indicus TaxID=212017 RepID=A0A0G2UUG3_LETIN|nr:ATP synthase F0 subunit 6 [Lethocerus indicus]